MFDSYFARGERNHVANSAIRPLLKR